jgi:hypothetical protein
MRGATACDLVEIERALRQLSELRIVQQVRYQAWSVQMVARCGVGVGCQNAHCTWCEVTWVTTSCAQPALDTAAAAEGLAGGVEGLSLACRWLQGMHFFVPQVVSTLLLRHQRQEALSLAAGLSLEVRKPGGMGSGGTGRVKYSHLAQKPVLNSMCI